MIVAGFSVQVPAEGLSGTAYQVQKNDSLYKIAGTQLGSGDRWTEIYELNKDAIKDPFIIYTGQIFSLPASGQDLSDARGITADDIPAAEENKPDEQKEADKYAEQLYDAAKKAEPGITVVLKALESDKAHLEGLEHCLKSVESTSRKILTNAHDMEISPEEASKIINDSLRYTFVINDQDYVETTRLITDTLIACGYSIVKFKNYWAKKDVAYQGINALFKTKEGVIFELQFHTTVSYYTKGEKTHGYYEIMRSETASEKEKAEASKKQDAEFALIPVPEGAEMLSY